MNDVHVAIIAAKMIEDEPTGIYLKPAGIAALVVMKAFDRHTPSPSKEIVASDPLYAQW